MNWGPFIFSISLRLGCGLLPLMLIVATVAYSQEQSAGLRQVISKPSAPIPITWTTGTGKWVGYWGRRETVLCPAGGRLEGAWGTDIYTDDSSICSAAVHAGLISVQEGGQATIEMRPDYGQYAGSVRNGVRTGDWMEPWTGAYVFVQHRSSIEPAITATSVMQADSWAGQAGRVLTFACGSHIELHTVYGTDIYTDDSYICSAAVHRGVITQQSGGLATIQLLNGHVEFAASTRNGVTSLDQSSWKGHSYMFVATPPDTPHPPTAGAPFDLAPATAVPPDRTRL